MDHFSYCVHHTGIDAVLKVQKPANDWEFYICTEVQKRIPKPLSSAFMAIPRNYVFQDGGVFVSYHQKLGTLLDIINIVKKVQGNKFCIEPMAAFFTIELLGMVDALHKAGIVHADLKADNLLLQVSRSDEENILIIHRCGFIEHSHLGLIGYLSRGNVQRNLLHHSAH